MRKSLRFFKPDTIFSTISLYVIPCFTLILASVLPWSTSNLSVIGNYYDRQLMLALWGILTASHIYFFMKHLFRLVAYENKWGSSLVVATSVLLVFAVTTPYLPEQMALKSWLHEVFAFSAPIVFLGAMVLFLRHLEQGGKGSYRRFWLVLLAMMLISFLILLKFRFVNSVLELFVTIGICYFFRLLELEIMAQYGLQ